MSKITGMMTIPNFILYPKGLTYTKSGLKNKCFTETQCNERTIITIIIITSALDVLHKKSV
jgi:hypothetical protein